MEIITVLLILWFLITSLYILFWIVGNTHRRFSDFIDDQIPAISRYLNIIAGFYFFLGLIIIFLSLLGISINFSPGLTVAALGIAIFSYSMAQHQNFKSKKEGTYIKRSLQRIEQKLNSK
jgi:hypothetical protein